MLSWACGALPARLARPRAAHCVVPLRMLAQPSRKMPDKTVTIFCRKCTEKLFKYRKGGNGALVKCWLERIVEDFTREPCVCPKCGVEFARHAVIKARPAYKFKGGSVFMKK